MATAFDIKGRRFQYSENSGEIEPLEERASLPLPVREFLFSNPSLLIASERKVREELEDTQPLYLFPLTALDLVEGIQKKGEVGLSLKAFDPSADYFPLISSMRRESAGKGIERFGIEFSMKGLSPQEAESMGRLIERCRFELGTLNSVVVDGVVRTPFLEEALSSGAEYVRFNMPFLGKDLYEKAYFGEVPQEAFLGLVESVASRKKQGQLVSVRAYLRPEDAGRYVPFSEREAGVLDLIQISKALQPVGAQNPKTPKELQEELRGLAERYDGRGLLRFTHVKGIDTLYYPLFSISEEFGNYRECGAGRVRPTIVGRGVFPCSVKQVVSNPSVWSFGDVSGELARKGEVMRYAGKECSDCASLFENDLLGKIAEKAPGGPGAEKSFYLLPQTLR